MTIKADRSIQITLRVDIPVDEVVIVNDGDFASFLHDNKLRKNVEKDFLREIDFAHISGTVVESMSSFNVQIQSDSQAEYDAMVQAAENLYESRRKAVEAIGDRLGIKECVWSFMPRGFGLEGNYMQHLIDNDQLCEGKVRFIYEGGWDDEETVVCPVVYENPTMEDVFAAADLCLRLSNDKHHVFVEGVSSEGVDSDGVRTLSFYYGS